MPLEVLWKDENMLRIEALEEKRGAMGPSHRLTRATLYLNITILNAQDVVEEALKGMMTSLTGAKGISGMASRTLRKMKGDEIATKLAAMLGSKFCTKLSTKFREGQGVIITAANVHNVDLPSGANGICIKLSFHQVPRTFHETSTNLPRTFLEPFSNLPRALVLPGALHTFSHLLTPSHTFTRCTSHT